MTLAKYEDQKRLRRAWAAVPKAVRSAPPICPVHLRPLSESFGRLRIPFWACSRKGCDRTAFVPVRR